MKPYEGTRAVINLDHLEHNYRRLTSFVKDKTKICCVIKANGYGHGSLELARLYEELGADYFAVATVSEAVELRKNKIGLPIMCLGYVPESSYEEMIKSKVDIPVFSYETARRLSEVAGAIGECADIHIKIDSGMSRIGFQCTQESIREIEKIRELPNLYFKGIFTHFARADETQRQTTLQQFDDFISLVSTLESREIHFEIRHCCNTAGTVYYPEFHLDMVRLGISLYGYYPSDDVDKEKIELRPAMSLYSSLSHIKKLERDRGISYGHKYKVEDDHELIGTVAIGYADGFTRMLNTKADLEIQGECCEVVGSICMDQCMVRLNKDGEYRVGETVTVYSDRQGFGADRLARRLGTISYEIICMLSRRVPRIYMRNNEIIKVIDYLKM
ncbi:MAG: alanine racemase, partial [Filifactor alocis]|nr:alanine racemase [Filifactor alocis]